MGAEQQHWHVRVKAKSPRGKDRREDEIVVDQERAWIEAGILEPRRHNQPITVNGRQLAWADIESVRISVSDTPSSTIIRQLEAEDAASPVLHVGRPSYAWRAAERARDMTNELMDPAIAKTSAPGASAPDPKKVMVVFGRDSKASDAMFDLLERLHLKPREFGQLIESTGKGAPFIGEILDRAFQEARAVVVLLTPDDEARLREDLQAKDDPDYEKALMPQARPNVLFEAGMALGLHPDRTIMVQAGSLRPFSDIYGRHIIRLNGKPEPLREIARRLRTAGCDLDDSGDRWLKTKFPAPRRRPSSSKKAEGADLAERKKLMKAAADAVTNALKAFDRRKGATEENVAESGEAFDARVLDVALLANQVTIEFGHQHPATQAYERAHAGLEALTAQVFDAKTTVLDAGLGTDKARAVRDALGEFLSKAQTA